MEQSTRGSRSSRFLRLTACLKKIRQEVPMRATSGQQLWFNMYTGGLAVCACRTKRRERMGAEFARAKGVDRGRGFRRDAR